MKFLLFLLLAGTASASTLNQQLRSLAEGADRVELMWRPEYEVEAAGVVSLKAVYTGNATQTLLAKIEFVHDNTENQQRSLPPGAIAIPNCRCVGSHLLRFWSKDRLLIEVSFHHGTHLRAQKLNGGEDATLTQESQNWLRAEADWDADLLKIENYQSRPPCHRPERYVSQPTRMPVTFCAYAQPAPSTRVADL